MSDIYRASCQDLFHPGNNCNQSYLRSLSDLVLAVVKTYAPFNALSAFHQEGRISLGMAQKTLQMVSRTSLFYGTSVLLYSFLRCRLRDVFGFHDKFSIFLAGAVAYAVGSKIEDPAQLLGMLVFQGKDTLETLGTMAISRGVFPPMKYGSVLVFGFAMGVLNYYSVHDPQYITSFPVVLFMKLVLGKSRSDRDALERKIFEWLEKNSILIEDRDNSVRWKPIDVIVGIFKNFVVGFSFILLLDLVRRRSIKDILVNGASFGTFLSTLLLFNRGLPIILKELLGTDISVFTGFVTGLAMYFWQSTSLATFALANALCILLSDIGNRTLSPTFKSLFLCILYGLSTSISLYALQFENYAVPESWKKGLLSKMAGGQDLSHYEEFSKKLQTNK